ncbi:uncharacterized protein VTP21DRAFT_7745 [Calcarisporiella thermophila]|uniref:uncharacterized protein n=1 Tax=Calcarisporiella thermophila TaxID=911321 RepID=UPI0037426826
MPDSNQSQIKVHWALETPREPPVAGFSRPGSKMIQLIFAYPFSAPFRWAYGLPRWTMNRKTVQFSRFTKILPTYSDTDYDRRAWAPRLNVEDWREVMEMREKRKLIVKEEEGDVKTGLN